ncbi:MAG: hypothetical protein AAFO75_03465 [Pseudomonadota bacterium]
MSDTGDKPSTGGGHAQPPLPFGNAKEHGDFLDVLAQLEAGSITPEVAQRRVMVLYQMGMGAMIRALGEARPEVVSQLVDKLSLDLNEISKKYGDGGAVSMDALKPQRSGSVRLKSKSDDILKRERTLLIALLKSNQSYPLSELVDEVHKVEPGVKAPALTANLDRLAKAKAIDRPSKGYYASTPASRAYLASIESEMEARGIL